MRTFLLVAVAACFTALETSAGPSDQWSRLKDWDGPGAQICAAKYGPCLQLSCAQGEALHLRGYSNSGKLDGVGSILLRVDGRPVARLGDGSGDGWRKPPTLRDPGFLSQAIQALSSGGRAEMHFSNGGVHGLTLRGASSVIAQTLQDCAAQELAFRSALDTFNGAYFRYEDEGEVGFPPGKQEIKFERYKDIDVYGGDIRSALTDGFLTNMSINQCEALCEVTQDCMLYTVNTKANACFLKNNVPKTVRYKGAVTGEFKGSRFNLSLPATRGPGTIVSPQAAWLDGDHFEGWLARRKTLAKRSTSSCSHARKVGSAVSSQLRLGLSGVRDFGVESEATVRWSGLNLKDRIPIWLMVSADKPVRFGGPVGIALGPSTPNPFGIEHGSGKHRVLVALFSRGAGESGELTVAPLGEGEVKIEAHVIQYLPECDEEIVHGLAGNVLDAKPGAARLVLNNEAGNSAFTHEIQLRKFDRVILLNDSRFLLLESKTGTEILQKAGTNISVSPTHRFVAVNHGGKTNIVDVIDGTTVAQLDVGELYWGLEDSYAMTTAIPWGEVNLASLFGGGTFLEEQVTGPSCCYATPHSTKVAIDLENASFSVWGTHGHALGSLQFPNYALREAPRGGYSSRKSGSWALFHHFYNSLGSITAISMSTGFDIAGGWKQTASWADQEVSAKNERTERPFADRLAIKLGRVGLTASKIGSANNKPLEFDVPNQFARLGLSIRPMTRGDIVFNGNMPEIPEAMTHDAAGKYRPLGKQRALALQGVVSPLGDAARRAGWRFDWSDNIEVPLNLECYHVDLHQSEHAKSNLMLVRDINWLARLDAGSASFFVSQAWCTAGATFGSLRPTTAIYFHDFSGSAPQTSLDIPMETAFFFENDPSSLWYDHPLSIKGDAEVVLLYAVRNGAAAVFSRKENRIIRTFDNLPDGELMIDAFLTENLGHLVQLNADGGLHVFNVATGGKLLSGRIVDDEIVVWSANFAFEGTAEAAALIDLVFPGKHAQFSLDRFANTKRVEGLARHVLAGRQLPVLDRTKIPPTIAGKIELQGGDIVIRVSRAEDRSKLYSVFQEGVLTKTISAEGEHQEIRIPRLQGARWISVIGADEDGLASLPLTRDLGADPIGTPVQRALIVGVNTYSDVDIPSLNYALRDGGRYAETISSDREGAPPFEKITFLKDRRATPEAILKATEKLLKGLGPADHAVLFFAGHGLRDKNGEFYFGTSATALEDISGTALSFSELAKLLERTKARVTILLDACHSGAVGTGAFATSDEVASDLTKLQSNITILAASKGREFSQETSEAGGGVFTYALERVLKTDRMRYDLDGNGRLEASELYRGVKAVVEEVSQGKQTPWLVKSRMVGDYALF